MAGTEGYYRDDDEKDGDGAAGGSGAAALEPSYARGPVRSRETAHSNDFNEVVPPDLTADCAQDLNFESGPPLYLSQDGYVCENGYTVILWEDGFYYLYDKKGKLVEGEYFENEDDAILRAEGLEPPPGLTR